MDTKLFIQDDCKVVDQGSANRVIGHIFLKADSDIKYHFRKNVFCILSDEQQYQLEWILKEMNNE